MDIWNTVVYTDTQTPNNPSYSLELVETPMMLYIVIRPIGLVKLLFSAV